MTWILATWAFLLSTSRSVHVRDRPLGPWLASNASCASSRTSPMRWSTWTENGLKKQTKWWQTLRTTWRRERYTMSLGQLNGWLFVWEEPLRDAGIEEPLQTLQQVFFWKTADLNLTDTSSNGGKRSVATVYNIYIYIKHWKTKKILKDICRIPFCTLFFLVISSKIYQNMSPKNGRWKKIDSNAQKTPPMKSDEIRTENLVIRWNPDKIREVDFSSNIFLKKWSSSKSLLKNWSSNI